MARLDLEIGSATDVGRRRAHNEDSILVVSQPGRPEKGVLCAVADGMGGHAAGEVASDLAVKTLSRCYYETDGEPAAALKTAVRRANEAVWEAGNANPDQQGMGTTLVCAAILGSRAIIANVGDSQAYLVQGDAINLVTRDHSWVAEQVARGRISEHEAEQHPLRNVLTRSLGVAADVAVDLYEVSLEKGGALLLCSDGLTNHVRPEAMRQVVRSAAPRDAARKLVELANADGGSDNISVIVVQA